MDSSFTFPRPQAAVPRSQPPKSTGSSTRESNALRASVLDAALELGIGNNSLVADWMFNNAVVEEDEGEYPISSPSLTYGSSATSEESSSSALTPSSSISSSKYSGAGAHFASNAKSTPRMDGMLRISESEADTLNFDSNLASNNVTFPEIPIPSRPITPVSRKLRKKNKGDGYESDGGYISESAGKKKEKKKGASKDTVVFPSVETEKEAKKRAKEEKKELDEVERKRKKSLISAVKASKKAESKEAEQLKAYDTDGGGILGGKKIKPKKSKSKLTSEDNGGGYETDGAASTPVKKSKTRFFKLSNKASRPDLRAEAIPALPMPTPKEVVPLPIAERFATTLNPTSFSPTSPSQMQPSATSAPPIVSLPSTNVESVPMPLPPLTFQPFAPPPPTQTAPSALPAQRLPPTASLEAPADRASKASTESSSSSGLNPRRKAGHFSPDNSNDGQGSGSHSTLISSQIDHSNGTATAAALLPSPPNSGRALGGSGSLALPTISFPNTRSVSPIPSSPSVSTPPVTKFQIIKGLRMKPSLELIGLSPRGDKPPSPISPISPLPMSAPLLSAATSPTLAGGVNSPSQPYSSSLMPLRPTNLPSERLAIPNSPGGQPSRSPSPYRHISPPITATGGRSPRPSQLMIPSTDYIVPSPRHSVLPSPNVLAYYDIPPPSPPPMGPLPTVPPLSANGNNQTAPKSAQFPSAAVLRQRFIDRTPRQLPPEIGSMIQAQATIQRGKESPFPSRPVIPGGTVPTSGLVRQESRVTGTHRYRDFYPQATSTSGPETITNVPSVEAEDDVKDTRRTRFRDELSWINTPNGNDDDDESAEGLRGVLDCFDDTRRSDSEVNPHPGNSLERSHSLEMLHEKPDPFATSPYASQSRMPRLNNSKSAEPILRETLYQFDDDGRTVGDRTSRWSGSIYSRASILDEDVSGETRERLVNQVERMLEMEAKRGPGGPSHGSGHGRGFVPPVPRLPDAYTNTRHIDAGVISEPNPTRSWNRF